MPWCDACSRFWNPNTLPADGRCPSCGAEVAGLGGGDADAAPYRAPWHFWVLVVAAAVYLVWRLVQLVGELVT